MESEILSESELRRYTRQINLESVGIKGQEKIKKASVLVIGAGGKGASVLQNLVAAGVGKIGISDNLPVEEKNLIKQRLYGNTDIGKQKAIISWRKLIELNHFVNFELHNICIDKNNVLDICKNYAVIVDATDNFPSKYLINDAAIILKKPLVFGTVHDPVGMVSVFNYNMGPSLRCLFPTAPSDKQNSVQKKMPSAGILYSMTGTIMANEVLKIILQINNIISGKLLLLNMLDYTISFNKITKNPKNLAISSLS
jgi:molybdopterin/thiamine biosynthesis adenylyltransferase